MIGVDKRSVDEILVETGVLNIMKLKQAWDHQRGTNKKIEDVLVELGFVTPTDIMVANATKFGMTYIDLSTYIIKDSSVTSLVSKSIAIRYNLIPLEKDSNTLTVAMSDPTDIYAIDDLKLATGLEIKALLADTEKILNLIRKYYPLDADTLYQNAFGELEPQKKSPASNKDKKSNTKKTDESLFGSDAFNEFFDDNKIDFGNYDEEKGDNQFDFLKKGINNFEDFGEPQNKSEKPEDNLTGKGLTGLPPLDENIDFGLSKDLLKPDFNEGFDLSSKNNFSTNKELLGLEKVDDIFSEGNFFEEKKEDLFGSNEIVLDKNNFAQTDDIFANNDFLNNNTDDLNKETQVQSKTDSWEEEKQDAKSNLFKDKIGDLLVRDGAITIQQLNEALSVQAKSGEMIGKILTKKGFVKKKSLYEFLEKQLGLNYVNLDEKEIDENVVNLISENIARRYVLIPFEKDSFSLKVAMNDPVNIYSLDDLRLATGLDIIPFLGDDEQILKFIDKLYIGANKKESKVEVMTVDEIEEEFKQVSQKIADDVKFEEENEQKDNLNEINDIENAPIVKMVNIMFQKAVSQNASDVHIEPQENNVLIRYRIDGQLVEVMRHEKRILNALVARIKIISGLNIAEKRLPQDGRITLKLGKLSYDMRVSTLPTMFGEKIVIRIASKDGFVVNKTKLGLFEDDLNKFDDILAHPYGIVLVTGPTGSGKSTTLYAALRELCKPNINIMTVEDPVECTVKGVNQVQVNQKAGLDFAKALRAFLRQDPDIIMVGEIRDAETAEIASRAAITGHLVLSTLHTNDASSSITRLIDMGIEPFIISSSIVGVIAQRLVRRLCTKCKEEYTPEGNDLLAIGAYDPETTKIYKAVGCEACNDTGYRGRIAVYEIMTVSREMRQLMARNANTDEIKEAALRNGMKTLRANCIRMIKEGITTVEELLRISYAES